MGESIIWNVGLVNEELLIPNPKFFLQLSNLEEIEEEVVEILKNMREKILELVKIDSQVYQIMYNLEPFCLINQASAEFGYSSDNTVITLGVKALKIPISAI